MLGSCVQRIHSQLSNVILIPTLVPVVRDSLMIAHSEQGLHAHSSAVSDHILRVPVYK